MPVILSTNPSEFNRQTCAKKCANPSAACRERSSRCLNIGLINNMPDSALEATERQFVSLLGAASEEFTVRLRFYFLPGVTRSGASASRIQELYSSTESLLGSNLDGLIVTGREPLTPNLADEPYWKSFGEVLELARNHTYSTVWSCLAAHAAVLYQDGIGRIRSEQKHFGVFDCERLADHFLTNGIPPRFKVPHSRWNGLREEDLKAHGYTVLSRAADAGVDMFIQQHKSLFVFFQGHPEYAPNTPMLEYRRDVGRFLRGEMNTYPLMPEGYFDAACAARLTELRKEGIANQREELLTEVAEALEGVSLQHAWHSPATRIYGNWLRYISARKLSALTMTTAAVVAPAVEIPHVSKPELAVPFMTRQEEFTVL
jgi:homoserine O-succinyltransferase/O-acetyltransferase